MNRAALREALSFAAIAVDESESGRPDRAMDAYLTAGMVADGLFMPSTAADAALSVILEAASPVRYGDAGRAALFLALSAASLVIAGHRELPDAFDAAAMLEPSEREALTVLLAEIRAIAEAGVTA